MDLGDLNKVWEIKTLKKPGEDEARKILDRISKQIQPIMHRRKWRVKLLSEFCPANPSLLGLNVGAGSEVKLRLRRPNRDCDFYPLEQVLDTMLHELTHIEHGPHNAEFYKLWDELRKECDDLMAKGISGTGEGFDGPSRRVGGFTRKLPESSLRHSALAAAQKRARVGTLLPPGPRRLGGDNGIMSSLSPIQAAAMAAERRMHDELWCGSVSQDVELIDGLDSFGESSNTNFVSSSSSEVGNTDESLMWACKACTLLNQPLAPICNACGAQKPQHSSNQKTWPCRFCTMENSSKLDNCSACGQWRYSNGPPVATSGAHYGT